MEVRGFALLSEWEETENIYEGMEVGATPHDTFSKGECFHFNIVLCLNDLNHEGHTTRILSFPASYNSDPLLSAGNVLSDDCSPFLAAANATDVEVVLDRDGREPFNTVAVRNSIHVAVMGDGRRVPM